VPLHYRHDGSRYRTMHLVFDIFQGMGIAAAVGIRPFLPALAVGALADADAEIHFNSTDYSFLQSPGFLLGMAVGAVVLALAERHLSEDRLHRGPGGAALAVIALALGALFFAGSLGRGHYAIWPGIIAGVLCAAIGLIATRPLFARVRARLDPEAASAVPLYAEGIALLTAILSVLVPPLGLVAVVLLAWLLLAGRRREGQKYAGLRILK
jgi:Domain of unknown function (DUF4126)